MRVFQVMPIILPLGIYIQEVVIIPDWYSRIKETELGSIVREIVSTTDQT
jgi:hypothetical protein